MDDARQAPGFLPAEGWRLVLFGGKGGVGKTTAAAATAVALASQHPERAILLVSTDPAHSLQDSFASSAPPPNLKVVELDAQACLQGFKETNRQRLLTIASRGTFLDEEDIEHFLQLSLPGMDEMMGFLEISRWVQEGTYATIVVDTAPTGHTLRLMAMPDLMKTWLDALDTLLAKHRYMKKLYRGSYQRDDLDHFIEGLAAAVKAMEQLLRDHARCRFVPVMLAEAMSIEETLDLLRELQRLGIAAGDVVVNRLFPESGCPQCQDIRSAQMRQLARLAGEASFADVRLWGVPMYAQEVHGLAGLRAFWEGAGPLRLSAPAVGPGPALVPPRVEAPLALPGGATTMLVFAGKGGVGKTTLACATALHLARAWPGRRILLFSADPAHSLADCLDLPLGSKPSSVVPGLWAMEMDASADFAALKEQYRTELSRFLSRLLPNVDMTFDREVMERLMDLSPPGIDEMMALVSVMDLLTPKGYDLLVLDAAPTGHLVRLLEMPEVIEGWLKVVFGLFLKYRDILRLPGIAERLVRLSRDLKRLRALLRDPAKASLYSVSILTAMSLAETGDLLAACERLAIPVPGLFLNLATADSADPLCAALFARGSRTRADFAAAFPATPQALVYRQSEPRGVASLEALGQLLYRPGGAGTATASVQLQPAAGPAPA